MSSDRNRIIDKILLLGFAGSSSEDVAA